MDCGPTCLQMIANYYGRKFNLDYLRKLSGYGKEGVSLYGISDTAEKIGFKTIGIKLTYEQLANEINFPAILHWGQNHFVVLLKSKKHYASKGRSFILADPKLGKLTLTKEDFLNNWISTRENGKEYGIALLLEPTSLFFSNLSGSGDEDLVATSSYGLGWKMVTDYLFQYKRYLLLIFLAIGFGSFIQLLFPFLTQSLVDKGINGHNLSFIYLILIAQSMLFLGRTVMEFIRSRVLLFISTHINLSILSDFWIKLTKLPIAFFDTKKTGDIVQRIGDHKKIESFLTGSTLNVLFSIFNLLVFAFILLSFNTTVFFVFFGATILYVFWIKLFLRFRRVLNNRYFSIASKENTATMQLIYGMQEIKLNGAEQEKRWGWESLQAQLFKLNFKSLSISQYQQAGSLFINEGKNILITFIVSKAVLAGDNGLSLGAMMAIQYIVGQLNSPVEQLISFFQQAQDAKISLERLNDIHQLDDEEPINKTYIRDLPQDKSITLSNLSFAYNTGEMVLKNINLKIPENKITAIVGVSGSGKTTLLKVLLRFYENYSGEILIGAGDLRHISHKFWRKQCGSVMQEGYIFNDSIAKNICVAEETIDFPRLIQACKVANILSFIEKLPLGFNTKIGAEGSGISAGQKQRILIARAVYKNPQFLFFDEATNSLDANNEREIITNLNVFFKERTVVVVAHRLSTVMHADNIVVLVDGIVVEQGTHEELVKKRGEYLKLVKNQLELGQ